MSYAVCMNTDTETLHGIAKRHIATGNGQGIEAGEPVRVREHEYAPGKFSIKAAGKRRASYLTWAQVVARVEAV